MATSPACFDIYMEDFLKNLKEKLPETYLFWYLAYADDLVFAIPKRYLRIVLNELEKLS